MIIQNRHHDNKRGSPDIVSRKNTCTTVHVARTAHTALYTKKAAHCIHMSIHDYQEVRLYPEE